MSSTNIPAPPFLSKAYDMVTDPIALWSPIDYNFVVQNPPKTMKTWLNFLLGLLGLFWPKDGIPVFFKF